MIVGDGRVKENVPKDPEPDFSEHKKLGDEINGKEV